MSVKTVNTMLDWIEDNLRAKTHLPEMAISVGYSECYCSAQFRQHVGFSFQEYVNRRKLSCAAAQLVETDRTVLAIALDFGFSSHEAFTRAFKKRYGYSPSQCRRDRLVPDEFQRICLTEKGSRSEGVAL
jgi:AraC family multidrug resistance transcriptional activator